MFSSADRSHLRSTLLHHAVLDPRITGTALTGSAAADREDPWSDIDLAFAIADPLALPAVVADFTDRMYAQHQALHHLDVPSGPWLYRVFLLPGSLQVDLAFVPASDFRASAPTFRLVSGEAQNPLYAEPPAPDALIGLAWLYALHARTSLARNHLWQAEFMISALRDTALALACLRHNLPTQHGRGFDHLPPSVTEPFADALVHHLDTPELARALRTAIDCLLTEIHHANPALATKLQETLLLCTADEAVR